MKTVIGENSDNDPYMRHFKVHLGKLKKDENRHVEIDDRYSLFAEAKGDGKFTGWYYYLQGAGPRLAFIKEPIERIVSMGYEDGILTRETEGRRFNEAMTEQLEEDFDNVVAMKKQIGKSGMDNDLFKAVVDLMKAQRPNHKYIRKIGEGEQAKYVYSESKAGMKSAVKKITIKPAEGRVSDPAVGKKHEFTNFADADKFLRERNAASALSNKKYGTKDKTDFKIEWHNGKTYEGTHMSGEGGHDSLKSHIESHIGRAKKEADANPQVAFVDKHRQALVQHLSDLHLEDHAEDSKKDGGETKKSVSVMLEEAVFEILSKKIQYITPGQNRAKKPSVAGAVTKVPGTKAEFKPKDSSYHKPKKVVAGVTKSDADADEMDKAKHISKEQVGAKIKKLMAEGKPQDQAIAIALNMAGMSKKSFFADETPLGKGDKDMDKSLLDTVIDLMKAGKTGEGSRGGKVIGHTRSGKPVYDREHADNKQMAKEYSDKYDTPRQSGEQGFLSQHDKFKDWSKEDHADAAKIHHAESEKASIQAKDYKKEGKPKKSSEALGVSSSHMTLGSVHYHHAGHEDSGINNYKGSKKELPSHLKDSLDKYEAKKKATGTIEDVTPKGYGPDKKSIQDTNDLSKSLLDTVIDLMKAKSGGTSSSHKYIRRTGTAGNYQYWYKTPEGKMVSGEKPTGKTESGKIISPVEVAFDDEYSEGYYEPTKAFNEKYKDFSSAEHDEAVKYYKDLIANNQKNPDNKKFRDNIEAHEDASENKNRKPLKNTPTGKTESGKFISPVEGAVSDDYSEGYYEPTKAFANKYKDFSIKDHKDAVKYYEDLIARNPKNPENPTYRSNVMAHEDYAKFESMALDTEKKLKEYESKKSLQDTSDLNKSFNLWPTLADYDTVTDLSRTDKAVTDYYKSTAEAANSTTQTQGQVIASNDSRFVQQFESVDQMVNSMWIDLQTRKNEKADF